MNSFDAWDEPATDGALTRSSAAAHPRRTFRSGRLLLIRKPDQIGHTTPRARDVEFLLASLTARDVVILNALLQYRYLDLGQIEALFFTSRRRAERRLKWLRDEHLVHHWLAMESPGWRRRDSVFLTSAFGASVLAYCRDERPSHLVRQAEEGRDHAFHVQHDLEANGFFVDLASAGRDQPDQGLYHWVGEDACRRLYRSAKGDLAPDGWGRYLAPHGEIVFFLEWDRATSSPHRIQRKVEVYIRHFLDRTNADLNNVLFVTPDAPREDTVQRAIRRVLDNHPHRRCCTFWTTHVHQLDRAGVLGPAWRGLDDQPGVRLPFFHLAVHRQHTRDASACLAKYGWWERRSLGGETV